MRKLSSEAEKIMMERFGKDTVIALATVEHEVPYVRKVNAYYEDGSFYIITYALSNKIKQIEKNPNVAIAGDWFTAHGRGNNLGYFGKEENRIIAEKLRQHRRTRKRKGPAGRFHSAGHIYAIPSALQPH